MQPTALSTRLFLFRLPGVPDYRFGLPPMQVNMVVEDAQVDRIPLMPPTVHGVMRLQLELVPVIDLGKVLHATEAPLTSDYVLITQTMLNQKAEPLAWYIEPGASLHDLPPYLPTLALPTGWKQDVLVSTLDHGQPIVLIDTHHIPQHLT